jgi:signal transduction histidine kinase
VQSIKVRAGQKNNVLDETRLSWIGAIMSRGEKVLGVIATYSMEKEDAYSENDLEILQSMADLAAIALENTRLVREIADRERELVIGGLAIDFVHRVNNAAGTIPHWVTLVKRKLSSQRKQNPKVTEYLDNIVRDASVILNEAYNLRKPVAGPENVNMEEVIGAIIGQAELMISPNIKIVFEPEAHLLPVHGVKQQLSVAIDSIFQNAVWSISGQGEITISLKSNDSVAGDKKFIEITITDTGCGIPKDRFESIFDYGNSYWTDKKGTGYGLWRARNIIQSIGGSIKVTSSLIGKGSIFTILLPVVESDFHNH